MNKKKPSQSELVNSYGTFAVLAGVPTQDIKAINYLKQAKKAAQALQATHQESEDNPDSEKRLTATYVNHFGPHSDPSQLNRFMGY